MGKLRVYELARKLNVDNKTVLGKLKDLGVEVKNHMTALEGETVERVKALFVQNGGKPVEETRVRPNIIRRRKKDSQENPEADEGKAAYQIDAGYIPKESDTEKTLKSEGDLQIPIKTDKEKKTDKEPAKKLARQADSYKAEIHLQNKETAAEEDRPVIRKQKNKDQIIKDKTEKNTGENKPVKLDSKDDEKQQEKRSKRKRRRRKGPGERPAAKPDKQETESKEKTENEGDLEKHKKRNRRRSKRRRKTKDTPAKIIKLGPIKQDTEQIKADKKPREKKEVIAEPVIEEEINIEGAVIEDSQQPTEKELSSPYKKKGQKGRKSKKEDEDTDKKITKKKVAYRKKSIIEGKDLYDEPYSTRRSKAGGKKVKKSNKTTLTTAKAIKRRIRIDDTIVLSELAKRIGIKAGDMIKNLMNMGVMATVNQTIDFDTASIVAAEFGYETEKAAFMEESFLKKEEQDLSKMQTRPPVVTIMGHVDHGKTSLLDAIRKTKVVDYEAGHITQHIGAYCVTTGRGKIVFLDTPGHEAFTAMRSRGASVTDIVVLVVAADDGVMPQTSEAINHSKAAGVPIMVAINKIDKPGADPEKIKRQLAELGLTPEDWGGETIFVEVSAKKKIGLDNLLEMILLLAEMTEFRANPDTRALGRVIEAELDQGKGPTATVLIQEGTLKPQDAVVCGLYYGRIRSLLDDRGVEIDFAGPSMPVKIIGLSGVPSAGDEIIAVESEKDAKNISEHRKQKQRSMELAKNSRMSLENLFDKMSKGETQTLNLILKADVQGSIEALKDSLKKLSNEEVKIDITQAATGAVSESDVSLAEVSSAVIIGFNVRPTAKIQAMAKEAGVDMHFYNVIYEAIKDVQDAILGMMSSKYEEEIIGRAQVRQVFTIPKIGVIAGSYVTDGKIVRNASTRLLRDSIVIYDGKVESLRRFKDDAKEVMSGYECGIGIEKYSDIKVEDIIECYSLKEIKPKIQ